MSSESLDVRGWTRRELLAAAFVLAFLALQVGIPVVRLFGERPARFGWQMYTSVYLPEQYLAEGPGGVLESIPVRDHRPKRRIEVDYASALPAHLCRVLPDAVAIIHEQRGSARERHPCR